MNNILFYCYFSKYVETYTAGSQHLYIYSNESINLYFIDFVWYMYNYNNIFFGINF